MLKGGTTEIEEGEAEEEENIGAGCYLSCIKNIAT